MTLLLLSVGALFLAPLCVGWIMPRANLRAGLDGFVLVVIGGLVVLQIVPAAIEMAGLGVVAAAVAGLFLPRLFEGSHGHHHEHSKLVLLVAVLGLGVHALMDGGALYVGSSAHGHDHHGDALALGVLVHRLPMGIALWWTARPIHGTRWAVALLVFMALTTVAGYEIGRLELSSTSAVALGWFQALVAGSLLHMVWEPPLALDRHRASNYASAAGALLGAAAVYGLSSLEPLRVVNPEGATLGRTFVTLVTESAVALVVAFCAAGLITALIRPASSRWLRGGSTLSQGLRGMMFGLPLPLCSCGVVPVYQGLVRAGVPLTAGLAFLVATPELGIDAILVSVPLLGWEMTWWRIGAAAVVAFVVAVGVNALAPAPRARPTAHEASTPAGPMGARLKEGFRYGWVELFDSTAPWMLAGILLASLIEPVVRAEWLTALPAGLDVPLLALLGIPLYICASGATPLAAVLLGKGVSAGAVIAMLLTGPATNVTTFGVLSALHGRRTALWFAVGVGVAASVIGYGVNALAPTLGASGLSMMHAHGPSPLALVATAVLALALLSSLFRQGLRGMVNQVIAPFAETSHGHHDEHDAPSCCH